MNRVRAFLLTLALAPLHRRQHRLCVAEHPIDALDGGVPRDALQRKRRTRQRLLQDVDPISSYQPDTSVEDSLAIDLDVLAINSLLQSGSDDAFDKAEAVYRLGAYSEPYAQVELRNPLEQDVFIGTVCEATSVSLEPVRMVVMETLQAGNTKLKLRYDDENTPGSKKCQVGASVQPVFDGCLREDSTMYIINVATVHYFYDMASDNLNLRNIAGFSTNARIRMAECQGECPFSEYAKFVQYYGRYDYADRWVSAVLNGGTAAFTNGNADWESFDAEALSVAAEYGMVYMNIWMHVIEKMEHAIGICQDCTTILCPGSPTHQWDQAVAYYSGSQVSNENSTLLYNLADIRCGTFRTCAPDSETLEGGPGWSSKVNVEVFDLFTRGRDLLTQRKCQEVSPVVKRITQLMRVPLIQGALRYAHINADDQIYSDKHHAEASAFAASILPAVHNCSAEDAEIIYEALKASDDFPDIDYRAVKNAFERNYDCMNLTCTDVGGIFDEDAMAYVEDAAPCDDSDRRNRRRAMDRWHVQVLVYGVIGIAVALMTSIVVSYCKCGSTKEPAKETELAEMAESSPESDLRLEENGIMS